MNQSIALKTHQNPIGDADADVDVDMDTAKDANRIVEMVKMVAN
jgi:hypothetical protein